VDKCDEAGVGRDSGEESGEGYDLGAVCTEYAAGADCLRTCVVETEHVCRGRVMDTEQNHDLVLGMYLLTDDDLADVVDIRPVR
jgi:hypothetical protein